MKTGSLNGNQLKVIAMTAMTIDHLTSVIWPNYPKEWWILALHIIGRMAAPIFWFFIAEGYHYTRNWKKYAARLLLFAVISHFAYNFAFGIPFVPFQNSVLNQTSVIWSLFWGLIALVIQERSGLKQWQKTVVICVILVISFCSDWSCIAVLAIMEIAENRGNFKKQVSGMMLWVAVYAVVYMLFIDLVYGMMQLFVVLTVPLLRIYNGEKGKWSGMKYLFYLYYPLHLVICGAIRIALHGNVSVLF